MPCKRGQPSPVSVHFMKPDEISYSSSQRSDSADACDNRVFSAHRVRRQDDRLEVRNWADKHRLRSSWRANQCDVGKLPTRTNSRPGRPMIGATFSGLMIETFANGGPYLKRKPVRLAIG